MKILYFVLILLSLSLASLPAFALPGEIPIYQIRDFVNETTDCENRTYGGQTREMCDIAPALQAAVLACEANPSLGYAIDKDVRCLIEGMPGLFFWGSKVEVCHTIDIDLKDAKIFTGVDVSPIEFVGYGECLETGRPSAGASKLRNAMFRRFAVGTSSVVAIEAHAPVRLERLSILGYTQGINIYANGQEKNNDNSPRPLMIRALANSWLMMDVSVQNSEHSGITIQGPDTNVGASIRVGSTASCKQKEEWEGLLGPCADFYEGSFLGSVLLATSTGYAKDTSTNTVSPGIVLGDSANSRSLCLGCYIEGGYGGGVMAANVNSIAGAGGVWSGSGQRLMGPLVSALEAVGSDGLISIKLGSLTGGGALTLTPIGQSGTYPLRFKFDVATQNFLLNVGNVNYAHVLMIGAKATSNLNLGLGSLILRPSGAVVPVIINNTANQVSRQAYP